MKGTLFVVTAASGTGKTSLVRELVAHIEKLEVSISHTTRTPRAGEENGKDYHFTDVNTFLDSINRGEFIEHAKVFDNYYGTMQSVVMDMLNQGDDVILEIDWQGAEQVKRIFPDSVSIFILPPNKESLKQRLSARGQDSDEVIEKRLAGSMVEMRQYVNFDYLVVNDEFDIALSEMSAIIFSERLRIEKQLQRQSVLLQELFN